MITLAIDASTYAGDVAVLDGSRVLAEEQVAMRGEEQERLMPAVAAALGRAQLTARDVRRVVCGAGPGSFTSLRIAGAIAKGMASGVRCPLFAIPSMALILGGTDVDHGRYLVAIDALRGEFYVGLYTIDAEGTISEIEHARIIAATGVDALALEYGAMVVSPSRLAGAIAAVPRARAVARLEAILSRDGPVAPGDWEPAYGRLAEAQIRWERAHGRALSAR